MIVIGTPNPLYTARGAVSLKRLPESASGDLAPVRRNNGQCRERDGIRQLRYCPEKTSQSFKS
jgi:hypothetical protein